MKLKYLFGCFLMTVILFQCKSGEDAVLKEAFTIQDEAIHMGMAFSKELDSLMISDTSKANLTKLGGFKIRFKQWEKEMIPVPGIVADHNHDHGHSHDTTHQAGDGHDHQDHAGHNHGHVHANPEEISAQLTPAENKEMQIEWKLRIEEMAKELAAYKSSKG